MPARKLKPGNQVKGYVIEEEINIGNMAFAYRAISPAGRVVFLKKYKSPTVLVPWFRDFVEYQKEMKKRIEGSAVRNFTCELIEFFEARSAANSVQDCYFQAYEFVTDGASLDRFLDELKVNARKYTWEQRVIWAKVIMGSIATLHEAKIVHGDLKPPNLQLIKDESIKIGFRVKLIDMDFSILADRPAPWHGHSGYVGSPTYFSPEHLNGTVPQPASDVFTCGLILSELLGGRHPYGGLDDDAYKRQALAHSANVPSPLQPIPGANDAEVTAMIKRMLSPDLAKRPGARDVLDVLNGRAGTRPPPTVLPPPKPRVPAPEPSVISPAPPSTPPAPTSTRAPASVPGGSIRLENGEYQLNASVGIRVNQALVRSAGADARFWDNDCQFSLERRGTEWWVVPNLSAPNETLLNGGAVTEARKLSAGDTLACGRAAKGVAKLPLTVRLI